MKARLAILAVVLAAGAFIALRATGDNRTPLEAAREAVAARDMATALSNFEAHLKQNPDDHLSRIEYAQVLAVQAPDEAIKALSMIPDDCDQALSAAKAQFAIAHKLEQPDQLNQVVERLGKIAPDDFGVALTSAEHYFHNQRFTKALPWGRAAIEFKPERIESYLLVAEILDELNRQSEVVEVLTQALSLDNTNYAVRANLAHSLLLSDAPEDARTHAEWCLARKSNDAKMLRILASVERIQGNHPLALETIRRATALEPENVPCRVLEADLLIYARDGKSAYKLLKPLLDQNLNNRPFLGAFVRAAAMSGHRDEAMTYQRRIKELISQQDSQERIEE